MCAFCPHINTGVIVSLPMQQDSILVIEIIVQSSASCSYDSCRREPYAIIHQNLLQLVLAVDAGRRLDV